MSKNGTKQDKVGTCTGRLKETECFLANSCFGYNRVSAPGLHAYERHLLSKISTSMETRAS